MGCRSTFIVGFVVRTVAALLLSTGVNITVYVSVVVSGDPSDWGVGSSYAESRWWPELWSSAPPGNADPRQAAAEEELPKSSSAAGEP